MGLSQWHWARGEVEAAGLQAQAALDHGEALGDNFCRREGRLLLGMAALAAGDLASAERYALEALQIATDAQQALTVGRAERVLGNIAAASPKVEAARAHFAAGERILRQSGALIDLGQTLLARAQAIRAAGEAQAAWRPDLLEARRLFRRAKALPFLKQAEKLLLPKTA